MDCLDPMCFDSCFCTNSTSVPLPPGPVDYAANVPIAFALVTGSGLATTLGAAMVFCTRWVTQANHKMLGASLGFSSGVMLFVSFGEILQKSILAFADCGCLWEGQTNDNAAFTAALLCFFLGVVLVYVLDLAIHLVSCWIKRPDLLHGHSHGHGKRKEDTVTEPLPDFAELPQPKEEEEIDPAKKELLRLRHMGLMTACAIGMHNFPEGLATFVAALADPKVGAGLAVAIAIHNIPEGLCVAIPIYYATGSRWKGFWVAFFSGITELIGAALGYGFLMAAMSPSAYAVLFGLVAGMMVAIVVKELLPTAHRYDHQDSVVTIMLFIGMAVMALSLVLFRI
ncbi:hypothetical protein BASA81_006134 [Batrachochytrium salamandrivorans]|nr:hypothetical protein BASA81_006134 [Batrachochytrium salamandrivorans]